MSSSAPLLLFNPRGQLPSLALKTFVAREERLKSHVLFQSSGSTGNPKWVALSHSALETSAQACNRHLDAGARDVFGLAIPKFHVGGYALTLRAQMCGATLVEFPGAWSAPRFRDWLSEYSVSLISLVPAQVYDLIRAGLSSPESLRAAVVGGGALPPSLYLEARKLGWPLLPSYGLSECASQVATAELSSLDQKVLAPLSSPLFPQLFPKAKLLSHIRAEQVEPLRVRILSQSLMSFYLSEESEGFSLRDPKESEYLVLPDKVELEDSFVKVCGRWEEEYKVLGEWIRWDFLKKKFQELAYQSQLFLRVEIALLSDERRGNLIALLCEQFDQAAKLLVEEFNREVFPFERITHFYEGILPRSSLGKILVNKIKDISLKEISG